MDEPVVIVICPDPITQQRLHDTIRRITSLASDAISFSDFMVDLDDNASEITLFRQIGPGLWSFVEKMVSTYPSGPNQLKSDIDALQSILDKSSVRNTGWPL